MLECKLSGSLKLEGKVEIYMQTMIDKVRDEMLAQSLAAISDDKKTGVKSEGFFITGGDITVSRGATPEPPSKRASCLTRTSGRAGE